MLTLGNHALKIGSGATPRGGKSAYLDSGPFALVRSQNVHNHGFQAQGLAFISSEQANRLSNVELLENDVLVNITGDSVARVCLIDPKVLPARVNQHVAILRPKPEKIDPYFLRYFLIEPSSQSLLLSLASAGATRNALTKSMLENLEIPDININLQRRIGKTLKCIDDKIELNRQMNETLEAMARALFRDWFVDFGPTRRKAAGETDPVKILGQAIPSPQKAAPIAELFPDKLGEDSLPVGWKIGKLDDWAQSVTRTIKPNEVDQNTNYIGLEHMPRRSIALGQWETAAKVISNKSAFERGQILFGKLRPYFHKVGIAPLDGICSTDIVVVDGLTQELRAFVVTLMATDDFVSYTNQGSSGTKMPRTSWKLMQEYPIARADKEIVLAFSKLVQPMHDKILQSLIENQTLAQIRDLLLPKLMSGEIRLKDLEDTL